MKKAVIYIHGKGGNAEEAEHYKQFFPEKDVLGFDYKAQTPWEANEEFVLYFERLMEKYSSIEIIANSIGAYFAISSLSSTMIDKAYFISPIVNMERLIGDMMQWAGVSETELEKKGTIQTEFGEILSYEYLCWVRTHPVCWRIPTSILYGSEDNLQSLNTIKRFTSDSGADLTVFEKGEHWFHTKEQMEFLDKWICQ